MLPWQKHCQALVPLEKSQKIVSFCINDFYLVNMGSSLSEEHFSIFQLLIIAVVTLD